jgi:hypothetical protein
MQENNNKQESNTFSVKEMNANSRISIPISLARHNMGLAATIIGNTCRDASGYKIDRDAILCQLWQLPTLSECFQMNSIDKSLFSSY